MANGQISKLLEFANMQMAAEAFLSRAGDIDPAKPRSEDVRPRLIEGNGRASIFTVPQATQFTADYEVVTQYRNDPAQPDGTGPKLSTKGSDHANPKYLKRFRSI